MTEPEQVTRNRRAFHRRQPKGKVKITCRRGAADMGPNLALELLDLSETGVRLVVQAELKEKTEVSIGVEALVHRRPIVRTGRVVWCLPTADERFCIGVRLDKYLPYQDIRMLS